jgi:hypothetical protein
MKRGLINLFLICFLVATVYVSIFARPGKYVIPIGVEGDTLTGYEWSKTQEGLELLEQIPCYCGCKNDDHRHVRDCFWKDNGRFDKHGLSCTICVHITVKTKLLSEKGENICDIRKEIDSFYLSIKDLGTLTPMPAGCG